MIAILEKLHKKPKAFFYLDTHAGSGLYDISEKPNHDEVLAKHLLSVDSGCDTLPTCINWYQQIVKGYIEKRMYPGSPLIVEDICDMFNQLSLHTTPNATFPVHNMHINELHPLAFEELQINTHNVRFQRHKRDGFELLNALMPPTPNRGLVLIDPPYEQAQEYTQVVDSVTKAIKKWPQGIFAIWYPLLSPTRIDHKTQQEQATPKHGLSENMLKALSNIATNGMLDIRFTYQQASKNIGMYGSGMAIINPPWQLEVSMQEAVDYLCTHCQLEPNLLSHVNFVVPQS